MGTRLPLLMLLAFACPSAWAGEAAYTATPIAVLEAPQAQAKVIAKFAKRHPVEILGRQGAWANIRASNTTGWIRLGDLRLVPSAPNAAAPKIQAGAARKDTGIRGFSEEELLVGAPNHAEGEKLRRLGVSAGDAEVFARAANLKARRQDYFLMHEFLPDDGFPEGFLDE